MFNLVREVNYGRQRENHNARQRKRKHTKNTAQRTADHTGAVDPTKVTSRNEQKPLDEQQTAADYQFNQQSVYTQFLEQLQGTQNLSATLKKIFFDAYMRRDISVYPKTLDRLLNTLASEFQMTDPAQINQQIKYFQNNTTQFSGDFFETLRGILTIAKENGDHAFQMLLGQFLKAYDNYISAESTLDAIIHTCRALIPQMQKNNAQQMRGYLVQLEALSRAPHEAADMLKESVVPFLGKYISVSNEFGQVRDMTERIIHYLARLNMGTFENVQRRFSNFIDYCRYNLNLNTAQLKMIELAFSQTAEKPADHENAYFQTFVEVLKNGMRDNPSAVNKTMYKDILNALLLDLNTFMPLTHIFLPLTYNNQFMFSEIWIDRRQETDASAREYQMVKTFKLFLTFDIQNLGYFETVIQIAGKNAEINLNYPNALKNKNKEIREALSAIFSKRGFDVKSVRVSTGQAPQKLDKVFPNIYERKQYVNVSI
jgi:hypothetical protein